MPETPDKATSAKSREIVSFTIRDQAFCMDIEHVLEIRGWARTTTLPHAPDYVIGMMNLRGTVLPVLDLSLRLGLGKTEPGSRHVIIIARISEQTVGFLVEAVSDITTVSDQDMQATPDTASRKTQAFIKGVFFHNEDMIRAINVHAILPDHDECAA